MAKASDQTEHLVIRGELRSGYEKVLTPAAVAFIAGLERKRAVEAGEGVDKAFQLHQHAAAIVEGGGKIGRAAQRLVIGF